MIFGNRNFFNSVDNYINKNLALFELSKSYIEASVENNIFEKAIYFDANNKKNFLAPIDFFHINENILEGLTNFQILKPHYLTDIAIYHGDYEADLYIPFFNSINFNKKVSLTIQKEFLFLGKKEINVFVQQENDIASISFYSLFMFFVNLYCFDDSETLKTRDSFELFLSDKDSDNLFFYFLMAFKNSVDKIKPIFSNLYNNNYIDCEYSNDFINSNRRISLNFNIRYSSSVDLFYTLNIPIISFEDIKKRDFSIEFVLNEASKKFIFENAINKIIPYSIKFIGRKAPPVFKYINQAFSNSTDSNFDEDKVSFIQNAQREKIQNMFYQEINSRYFKTQIEKHILKLNKIYKSNIAAIEARKFIFNISDSLLKNFLMIRSLS